MKLPPLDYVLPRSLDEAIALLSHSEGQAKLLAGGQSLMPTLAFRLATPALLIDLAAIPGLDRIEITAAGVRLGARVRWVDIEQSEPLRTAHPLLVAAMAHVAHYQIRNRGTVGGSLAHADPAAEWPGLCVTCDAIIEVIGPAGSRLIEAGAFFSGPLSTHLAETEIITSITLPAWPRGRRWGFQEFSRRRGDFALAGIALHYDTDAAGGVVDPHIGVIGACHSPHRLRAAEQAISGQVLDAVLIAACAQAGSAEVDPPTDLHGSARYRRALVHAMLSRALQQA